MFWIVVLVVMMIVLAWAGLIFLRKVLWDAVHQNLLDLEDNFEGKVIRNGFAARPVFHGKIAGNELTINFSTAKSGRGRKTYIDISINVASDFSLTITEKNWQQEQGNDSPENACELVTNNEKVFYIMPADSAKVQEIIKKKELKDILDGFKNLAYFFIGQTGIICEFWSDKIDDDTAFEKLQPQLEQIQTLQKILNK